jgi:hypothetical protein
LSGKRNRGQPLIDEETVEQLGFITMSSFNQLLQVLEEQCTVTKAPEGVSVAVVVKPAKGISSDSLQNYSDPDATYDGYKGQGYQVQLKGRHIAAFTTTATLSL